MLCLPTGWWFFQQPGDQHFQSLRQTQQHQQGGVAQGVGDLIQWPGRPANEVATGVSPGPALSDDLLDEHGSHLWEWEGAPGVWVSVRPVTHQERTDRTSVFVVGS
ncbi:hypothetical protein CTJ15_03770 (plasmid) [Roseomonas sp. FDAARGOS_362]|nr:hypothetical protein CTJ15_03770 [Roseomonas sp. FDAARGOS_362]